MKEGSKVSLSVLIAALLIGGGLCVLAWSLQNLPAQAFPSSLYVTTDGEGSQDTVRDFLTLSEASLYTGLDEDVLQRLVDEGKLNGCFALTSEKGTGGERLVFSRDKLQAALETLMEQGESLALWDI